MDNGVKEAQRFTISFMFGISGGVFKFPVDPRDPEQVVQTVREIVSLATAPLIQQIELLKKRSLSDEEIQRFIHLVKAHPAEMRFDGRPTSDDLLAGRLESILKS